MSVWPDMRNGSSGILLIIIHSVILFTPALLCSRVVIFNTTEVAKDTLLKNLAMMTLAAGKLDFGDKNKSKAKFGELVVIINK
jgi:hypothetical protein